MTASQGQQAQGLEGVVAATTRLSSVDGAAGVLLLAGFPVEELAPHATVEEVVWLLWHGDLPAPEELAAFRRRLAGRRGVPAATIELLRAAARGGRCRRWTPCAWRPAR